MKYIMSTKIAEIVIKNVYSRISSMEFSCKCHANSMFAEKYEKDIQSHSLNELFKDDEKYVAITHNGKKIFLMRDLSHSDYNRYTFTDSEDDAIANTTELGFSMLDVKTSISEHYTRVKKRIESIIQKVRVALPESRRALVAEMLEVLEKEEERVQTTAENILNGVSSGTLKPKNKC